MRNLHDATLARAGRRACSHKWQLARRAAHRRDHRERDRVGSLRRTSEIIRASSRRSASASRIDDFGTGYTSLAYLARLAITSSRSTARSCSDMAERRRRRRDRALDHHARARLGLEVVAEGVETRATYDQLARLGCDTIQGFWLRYAATACAPGRARPSQAAPRGGPRAKPIGPVWEVSRRLADRLIIVLAVSAA